MFTYICVGLICCLLLAAGIWWVAINSWNTIRSDTKTVYRNYFRSEHLCYVELYMNNILLSRSFYIHLSLLCQKMLNKMCFVASIMIKDLFFSEVFVFNAFYLYFMLSDIPLSCIYVHLYLHGDEWSVDMYRGILPTMTCT